MRRLPPASRTSWPAITWFTLLLVSVASAAIAQQRPRRSTSPKASGVWQLFVLSKETDGAKEGLSLLDTDAKTWTPLAKEVQRGGRVSPNAKKYAWCGSTPGDAHATLWIVDLGGHAEPVQIPMEGQFGHLGWSPDSHELIVTTCGPAKTDLTRTTWRVSTDGSKPRKLPIAATAMVWDWSRDGRWLATSSGPRKIGGQAAPMNRDDIQIMRPDGRGKRLIRHFTGSSLTDPKALLMGAPPRFSPDSRSLLWCEAELGDINKSRVMVQALAGETPKEVLRAGDAKTQMSAVCWTPDSRSLVLQISNGPMRANDARFEVVDLAGRKLRTLSAKEVPDADKRVITYMMDCR
ncbi:MAG: hypothetical protein ACLQVF_19685 [Isosphaeraceae bacterium]